MFRRIAVGFVVAGALALAGCGSYTPEQEAQYGSSRAQDYAASAIVFEKTAPSGVKFTCLVIDGQAASMNCFPTPVPR